MRDIWSQLGDQFDRADFYPLPHQVFSIQRSFDAFRHMQQAKHIGKVVLTLPETPHPIKQKTRRIDPQGSYLITGGLGALGVQTAQWLVEQGAKQLILTGRRPPSDHVQSILNQLEATGSKIAVLLGDIAQQEETEQIFDQITATLPPLRGVIHAAGVLEDGLLSQLSWESFIRVMAPKVSGTWHLHQLTQASPLDFFVCFSSMASLLGSPGQGNYAAANAFMDGLMQTSSVIGPTGAEYSIGVPGQMGAWRRASTLRRKSG